MGPNASVVDITTPRKRTPPQNHHTIPDPSPSDEHRGTKRRRLSQQFELDEQSSSSTSRRRVEDEPIESNESLAEILEEELSRQQEDPARQEQEDTVKEEDTVNPKQGKQAQKREHFALATYRCPVCMDTPVDPTTTLCGKSLDLCSIVLRMLFTCDYWCELVDSNISRRTSLLPQMYSRYPEVQ